jgi:hypothetical protein
MTLASAVRIRGDLLDLRAVTRRWRIRRDGDGLPAIPGRRGSIHAHDRVTLALHLRGARTVRALLRALPPGWRRHQVGDDEATVLAPAADLDRACELVRAYRRRRLSDDHRARLVAAGRPFVSRGHESNEGVRRV